jgi:hypothetical protein
MQSGHQPIEDMQNSLFSLEGMTVAILNPTLLLPWVDEMTMVALKKRPLADFFRDSWWCFWKEGPP